MKDICVFLLISALPLNVLAQNTCGSVKRDSRYQPVFFLDSVNVYLRKIQKKIGTSEIAFVNVYKASKAREIIGIDGEFGAFYVFTKKFVRRKYWAFFRAKSEDFKMFASTPNVGANFQYILNDSVLTKEVDEKLYMISDTNFLSIRLLGKKELIDGYNVLDREFGFEIKTSDSIR